MPQAYAPVQHSIPEEDLDFSSDDDSNFRLHRVNRPASGSNSPKENDDGEPSILAPLVRKSADFETYLDSLTEDEQQLLTASKEYELDDLDIYGNGKAAARRRLSEAKKKRKQLVKPGGWRAVYYSKTWWRTLVVVIIALGLLVWGFLTYAASSGDDWGEYVRSASLWMHGDILTCFRTCRGRTRTSLRPREGLCKAGPPATKRRQG